MNKAEAAQFLGISVRTLQRYMATHKISYTIRRTRTGGEADFAKGELRRFKQQLEEERLTPTVKAAVSPVSEAVRGVEGGSTALATQPPVGLVQALGRLAETWERLAPRPEPEQPVRPEVRVSEKLSLSLREAAAISGYSEGFLAAALQEGRLKGAKGRTRGWNIKRRDLEVFIDKL